MTVISTIITKTCCAHACDSLITRRNVEEKLDVVEWLDKDRKWITDPEQGAQETKIARIEKHRGIMSFWGLAQIGMEPTREWLRKMGEQSHKFDVPEDFVNELATSLQKALSGMRFAKKVESGIGIHLTCYERIDGFMVPELFLVTNWNDINYRSVADQVCASRETYHQLSGEVPAEEHREPEFRHKVRTYLAEGGMFFFNNGDTEMFNVGANGILRMFRITSRRGWLDNANDARTLRSLASLPIELVSQSQERFYIKGQRRVGGMLHALSVTPGGEFASESGD